MAREIASTAVYTLQFHKNWTFRHPNTPFRKTTFTFNNQVKNRFMDIFSFLKEIDWKFTDKTSTRNQLKEEQDSHAWKSPFCKREKMKRRKEKHLAKYNHLILLNMTWNRTNRKVQFCHQFPTQVPAPEQMKFILISTEEKNWNKE